MKYLRAHRYGSLVKKLTSVSLAFSFAVLPFAPALAQETDVDTSTSSTTEEVDSLSDITQTASDSGAESDSALSEDFTVIEEVITPDDSSTSTPDTSANLEDVTPPLDSATTSEESVVEESKTPTDPQEDLEQGLDPPTSTTTVSTPEEDIVTEDADVSVSEAGIVAKEPHVATKYKKNATLSKEEQLSAVRQHLIDNNLPQNIIDRLDAYETRVATEPQKPGFIKKIVDFVTGNTDKQKEKKRIEELAKRQPFQVEGFEGNIRTENENSFEQLFPNQREQSPGLIQKIKNFIGTGSSLNNNFDGTQDTGAPLSWLLGSKAIAQVSQDPADYLDEGDEIVFSQAIQDQADALNNDPLSILNFVRNSVEYIPYYGSKKGSDATLIERAGNDMDQASLLIAMLRYSDIPARYRHVDIKTDIGTMTDLLGVQSATAAAQMLSLHGIPYILFTDNEQNPLFFVVEHTYVEAYIPYGYSRGADITDGGIEQWVPMDPTINSYYYEQFVDVVDEMNTDGFDVESFFDDYLDGDYGTSTDPLDAFKSEVEGQLSSNPPELYPDLTYNDALTRRYAESNSMDFIPGSLPYSVVADLNTYDYIPSSLRHTIEFTLEDDEENQILDYTAYVSDIADKELLITFDAATAADQATIDSFDTIYDVVPLSLVAVYTKVKVNGLSIATSTATTTLGQMQSYVMEFNFPTRVIGSSVSSEIVDTIEKDIIVGNTDAIALDTDRVAPLEFRPEEDVISDSFLANRILYNTATDYLYRLENTQSELARIIGGDFTDAASRATIFNGIEITYDQGEPYSFDWKGLRIDSSLKVRYFNRFHDDISTHKKEFTSVFGLQASQDESDIFEDNFGVESVATVKGIKLITDGEFGGVTLHKITSANENDIDTLTSISTTTRDIFHTAVQAGKTVYTPSSPITYGEWSGLFYISIDFDAGVAAYTIGEGLNGGYSVCGLPGTGGTICNWSQDFFDLLVPQAEASSISAIITANPVSVFIGEAVNIAIEYTKGAISWIVNLIFKPTKPGQVVITPQFDTSTSTVVTVTDNNPLGINKDYLFGKCDDGIKTGNCSPGNRKASDIKQIVIHYTAGSNAGGPKDEFWNFNKSLSSRTSAHYIVDRNGSIYQIVNDKDLAWHAGVRSVSPLDSYENATTTIGIELVNWGWVTLNNGKYYTYGSWEYATSSSRQIFDNLTAWSPNGSLSSYRYWEDFPAEQISSLNDLVDELVAKYDVQKVLYSPNIIDYEESESSLNNFVGILGHSVITDYKWDPGPAFQDRFLDLLGL